MPAVKIINRICILISFSIIVSSGEDSLKNLTVMLETTPKLEYTSVSTTPKEYPAEAAAGNKSDDNLAGWQILTTPKQYSSSTGITILEEKPVEVLSDIAINPTVGDVDTSTATSAVFMTTESYTEPQNVQIPSHQLPQIIQEEIYSEYDSTVVNINEFSRWEPTTRRYTVNDFMQKIYAQIDDTLESKRKSKPKSLRPALFVSPIKLLTNVREASFLSVSDSKVGLIFMFVDSDGNTQLHLFSNAIWIAEKVLIGHKCCAISTIDFTLGCVVETEGNAFINFYDILNMKLDLRLTGEIQNASWLSINSRKGRALFADIIQKNEAQTYANIFLKRKEQSEMLKDYWKTNIVQNISNGDIDISVVETIDKEGYTQVSIFKKTKILKTLDKNYHLIKQLRISSVVIGKDIFICLTSYCQQRDGFCDPRSTADIFKYTEKLSELQKIPTEGPIGSQFFQEENTTYLVILNALSGLKLYQYIDDGFRPIGGFEGIVNNGITGFAYQDSLLAITSHKEWNLGSAVQFYKIDKEKFKREVASNPIDVISLYKDSLVAKLRKTKKLYEILSAALKELRNKSSNEDRKLYTIRQKFDYPIIDSTDGRMLAANASQIESLIPDMKRRLKVITNRLITGIDLAGDTRWPENLKFSSLTIGSAMVDNLETRLIDDVDVPALSKLIPLKGYKSLEPMPKKVFRNIITRNPFVKHFSGSKLYKYVTLNHNHTLNKKISFGGISTPQITVDGLVDGLNISINSILLSSKKQRFGGFLTCNQASIGHLHTNKINEYDLDYITEDHTKSGSTYIRRDVHIKGDLIVRDGFYAERLFNHKVDKLKNILMKTNTDRLQKVKGNYRIGKAYIKNLVVKNINEEPLLESICLNKESRYYTIRRAILENAKAQSIMVVKSVNNIKAKNGSLDVMLLRAPQRVFGFKQFQHIHLMNRTHFRSQKFPHQALKQERYLLREHQRKENVVRSKRTSLFRLEEELHQLRSARLYLKFLHSSQSTRGLILQLEDEADTKLFRVSDHVIAYLKQIEKYLEIGRQPNFEEVLPPNLLSNYRHLIDELSPEPSNSWGKVYSDIDRLLRRLKLKIKTLGFQISTLNMQLEINGPSLSVSSSLIDTFPSSAVVGTVAGHYMETLPIFDKEVEPASRMPAKNLNLTGNVIFKNIKAHRINGIDVQELLKRAVPIDVIPDKTKVVFHQDVIVKGNLDIERINGQITSDFALANGLNVFNHRVTFKNVVAKGNVEVKGRVNSYKIKQIVDYIVRNMKGGTRFPDVVTFKNLDVDRLSCGSILIGGQSVDDIVLTNETAYVSGKKHFSQLRIKGLQTKIDELFVNKINHVKLDHLGRREVSGPLILRDTLDLRSIHVKGDGQFLGNIESELGSRNFERILAQSFSKENIILTGNLVLQGPTYVRNLNFSSTLQDLDAETFNNGLLLNNKDQLLTGRNTFGNVKVKNLIVGDGKINGVDLDRILTKAVKIDEDAVFPGDVVFKTIISEDSMTVNGLVQGINLTAEAIWDEQDVLFSAKKYFQNEVHLTGNLNVRGTINGMDVDRICRAVVGVLTINGPATFQKGIRTEFLSTDGYMVPLNADNSYWMLDKSVVIQSPTIFSSLHTNNLIVRDEINGISADKILEQSMPTECGKIATGNYVFEEVTCHSLDTNSIHTTFLNQHKADLLNKVILQGREQYFDDPVTLDELQSDRVTIDGSLNGHSVDDFCLKGQQCRFTGKKTFRNGLIVGLSEIDNSSTINGVSVGQLNLMQERFHVEEIYIEDSIIAPSIKILGTLNGIKFDQENIMTTDLKQHITGRFEVSVKDGLAIDAQEIETADGLFARLNITKIMHDKVSYPAKFEVTPGGEAKLLVKYAENIARKAKAVQSSLFGQATTFKGWKIINRLPKDVLKVGAIGSPANSLDTTSIAILYSNVAQIWRYSHYTGTYKYSGLSININCVNDVKSLRTAKDPYLITSSSCSSPSSGGVKKLITGSSPAIDIFSMIWRTYSNTPKIFVEIAVPNPLQIVVFDISAMECFLILSKVATTQSIYCSVGGEFYLQTPIITDNAFMAVQASFQSKSNEQRMLLIANKGLLSVSPYIDVLFYNESTVKFELQKRIKINRLIWFDAIALGDVVYLVTVTSPFCGSDDGEVIVYKILEDPSNSMVIEVQEIFELRNPLQAILLRFPLDTVVLVILDANGYLSTFEKRGIGKFSPVRKFHVGRNTKMSHWNSGKRPFLSITSSQDWSDVACENSGTRIYEAEFRGLQDTHNDAEYHYPVYNLLQ